MYEALSKAGYITRRSVRQAYDEKAGMFLPDRFVKGTCPICRTPDQYGDSCENCSGTYTPLDMIDPVSVVTGTRPVARESEHIFFRLGDFEAMLREWTRSGALQPEVANKLEEWFEAGLRDWDISRDAPYFGFEIPDAPGKYFYVWLDAPVGYMASFENYCCPGMASTSRTGGSRTAPRSCTTSSARTSSISTPCSGPRRSRARASGSRRPCTPTAS